MYIANSAKRDTMRSGTVFSPSFSAIVCDLQRLDARFSRRSLGVSSKQTAYTSPTAALREAGTSVLVYCDR